MKKLISASVAVSVLLFSTGCFKKRDIPAEQLITIYDSNLKETNKLAPLETMYVKIAGLAPNQMHKIEILDPNKKVVSEAEVRSNQEGVIEPMPIWYDIGLEKQKDGNFSITKDDLAIKAFYVRVKSLENDDTDFEQNFFLAIKKPSNQDDLGKKPIITSVSVEDGNISHAKIENTFFETGSKEPDGSDSNLTKVYVKAEQLPYKYYENGQKKNVENVDIYVVPFSGIQFKDGMDLEEVAVTSRKDVATDDNETYRTLKPTLIWDLNRGPQLINPGDSNNAYSIIIDVNQNGKLDIGEDLDGDGKYDVYTDAIDGQGAAGFIVMNTEANSLEYQISDKNGNGQTTLSEKESGDKNYLYFNMKNIPTSEKNVTIYVLDKDVVELEDGTDLNRSDVRKEKDDGNKGTNADITQPDNNKTFMPYIKVAKFITTQDVAGYGYTKDIDSEKKLDIVVDVDKNGKFDKGVDYYLPNAITILPFDADVTTTTKADGSDESSVFNEAHSDSNTTVYIRYGKDDSGSCSTLRYAYLYRADDAPKEGDELFGEILRKQIYTDNNCVTKFLDTNETFKSGELKIINPTDKNNKYVIIVDKNDNHKFDPEDKDKKLTISFKDTSANALPDVSYINLASGGVMGQPYQHWVDTPYTSAYDYRDVFTVSADDTIPPEYRGWSWWMTKGVKVVWNPYIKDRGWWWRHYNYYKDENGEEHTSPLNNGQIVDLYIISADDYQLIKGMELKDSMDVEKRHRTLPVQFSCRNGAYLQTIWEAPLKVGKYYVIVDINRNGKIDDGIDLIDAVTKNGTTIKENPNVVGFRVEED